MTEIAKTRVVIADDDADIRALVGIAVHKAGLDLVSVAWDCDTAWDDIQEHRPDLAVLDVTNGGFVVRELAPEVTEQQVVERTSASVRFEFGKETDLD